MTLKRLVSRTIPQPLKNGYHLGRAILAEVVFGFPGRGLVIIGVTGTNGKTTTTQMIGKILEAAGKSVALASTINFRINGQEEVNGSKFTTPSAWQLARFLRKAKKAGVTHVVLEVSSHALDQSRVWGIPFSVAVLTNVTREHLDYHRTMERYRVAKRRLFQLAKAAVINADMEGSLFFQQAVKGSVLLYGIRHTEGDLVAKDIELHFSKSTFLVKETRFQLQLPGLFNIENALAALGAAEILGIPLETSREALGKMTGIPGRMEFWETQAGVDIIIDYAVTPDAFEKLYASVLPLKIPGTKIIHVFGACGDRDQGKRPLLGALASEKADTIILTNEDPYFEDPEKILDEVEAGVTKKKDKDYFRIFDRREAIRKALTLAERGDIVLVTGKGVETSIAFGEKRVPWNERQVIEEELQAGEN